MTKEAPTDQGLGHKVSPANRKTSKPVVEHINIRVIAFEECGCWVAQCLEFDICAQAKTQEQFTALTWKR